MSDIDLDSKHAPSRRGPRLDRLGIASLAWTSLFAILTAVLVVLLR